MPETTSNPGSYVRKGGHGAAGAAEDERIDAEEFVARVLVQIPDPRRPLVRYYGAYSNRARGQRRKAEETLEAHGSSEISQQPVPHRRSGRRFIMFILALPESRVAPSPGRRESA